MSYKQLLRRNIRLFFFVDFLVHFQFMIPIWVAFYLRYISFTEVALLNAIQVGIQILFELPTGALADLIGRKRTMMIGWVLSGIGLIYVAFSHTFMMFLVSFIVRGLGEVMVSGSDIALFYDTLKELKQEDRYPRLASLYGLVIRISLMLGTLAGGYLFLLWPGLPYVLSGISQLIAGSIVMFFTEPHIDSEKFTLTNYVRQTREGFKELFKNAHNRIFTFFYMLVAGITWACLIYLNQPFAKDLGFSEIEMSWLFGSGYFVTAITLLIATSYMRFFNRGRVYTLFVIIMLFSLLPGMVTTKIFAIGMIILIQLAGSARFSFLDKYANDEFSSKYRATAVSGLNMLVSMFVMVTIGISGIVQDYFDTRLIFFALGIITLFIISPTAFVLVKRYKKD